MAGRLPPKRQLRRFKSMASPSLQELAVLGQRAGPCTGGRPSLNIMPLALRVVGRSEYFASGSGKHFWRSLSAVLMDAAPVLATQKRSDRLPEDPGGPCRAWIESDVKGGRQGFSSKGPHRMRLECAGLVDASAHGNVTPRTKLAHEARAIRQPWRAAACEPWQLQLRCGLVDKGKHGRGEGAACG